MKLIFKAGGIRKFKLDKKLSVKGKKLKEEMTKLWESYDNIPILFIAGMDIEKSDTEETLQLELNGKGYWTVVENNFKSIPEPKVIKEQENK